MRPNFPPQMAHRFAAPFRRYWGLLRIFVSCGLFVVMRLRELTLSLMPIFGRRKSGEFTKCPRE
jgi:hypothetical protein